MNPSVILLPMIAFKSNLHRLGQGGGYYDHTISDMRNKNPSAALFVGLGLEV